MVQLRTSIVVLCLSLFLVVLTVVSYAAVVRTINLSVDRNGVNNSGSDPITFSWNPSYGSLSGSAKFEILNPSGTVIFTSTPKPLAAGSETWVPTACLTPGIHTGRLTITANWNGDEYCTGTTTFTDKAEIQFKVCPAAWFKIYKFNDLNGNGIQDAGENPLQGWSFNIKDQSSVIKATKATGADGYTEKITLPVGRYCIHETIPSNGCWESTTTNPLCRDFVECDNGTVKFGNRQIGKFRLYKFNDLNGDGIKDPGEPPIGNWEFTVSDSIGKVVGVKPTDSAGYTGYFQVVPGTYNIKEELGQAWKKTTQSGNNPFTVNIAGCDEKTYDVGNWLPIIISGRELLDRAPWPWISPHYVGPYGQQNSPIWEPLPVCPQPAPPTRAISDVQPNQTGIAGVKIGLFLADGVTRVKTQSGYTNPTITGVNGEFSFGPVQYSQDLVIREECHTCMPPDCDTLSYPLERPLCALHKISTWTGDQCCVLATSPWPCRVVDFTTRDDLYITIPVPVEAEQVYDCNYFWNACPSRIWGQLCENAQKRLSSDIPVHIAVTKDGYPLPSPSTTCCIDCGAYTVPCCNESELRPGTYTLTTPPPPPNMEWKVRSYCTAVTQIDKLKDGSVCVTVELECGEDVRVDFCLEDITTDRRCFHPVTFTRQGWAAFAEPTNNVIQGGMLYNKFGMAFSEFTFFSAGASGNLVVGGNKPGQNSITFINKTASLDRLRLLLGGECTGCSKLKMTLDSPWKLDASQGGGCLAVETIALLMNIAYNDQRLMPRWCGVDLECYTITEGPLKGKTVAEALNIANSILRGDPPCQYGLQSCEQMVDVLQKINANYEFIDFNTYIDRSYLKPHKLIQSSMECQNRHATQLPAVCK